jgi:hypothetical protein
VPDMHTNGNGRVLLALSILEALNVDNYFLPNFKGACSIYAYFSNENIERRLRQKFEKYFDGIFRYHDRVVISRPAKALIKALLIEYHDNVGYPNCRRLMISLLKHCWWGIWHWITNCIVNIV